MSSTKDVKELSGDIWDDALLIRSYDNSLKLVKEQLAKRIAQTTNKLQNKNETSLESESLSRKCGESESVSANFQVGDYVRATYDDGVDYEAKIIYLDPLSSTCVIKYIGYENEQDINICNLIPSWGKKTRRLQYAKAKQTNKEISSDNDKVTKKSKLKASQSSRVAGYSSVDMPPPPPPPMPPMFSELSEDSEHLSAMLMSWYMSGYYTGLYHGRKNMKMANKLI